MAISLQPASAARARRIFARFVWGRGASDHISPAAPEEGGKGRLYQFLARIDIPSKLYAGYTASILVRVAGLSSGARGHGYSQPKLCIRLGDTFKLIAAQSKISGRLSVRGRWPADECKWCCVKAASIRDTGDVSLTIGDWAAFPKVGSPSAFYHENANLINGSQTSSRPHPRCSAF